MTSRARSPTLDSGGKSPSFQLNNKNEQGVQEATQRRKGEYI